jgi:hypothetical protein
VTTPRDRTGPDAAERERRRAARAWIRTHHPDVGGDPAVFAAGLAALRAGLPPEAGTPGTTVPRPRVTVVRTRGPRAWLRRLLGPRRPARTLR